MKKYIHAGCVGVFIVCFISTFSAFVPMAFALARAPVPPVCCSSVAFIPGLEASRLYVPDLPIENKLWEPFYNADLDKLGMDSGGKSLRSDVYTRDTVDNVKIGLINTPNDIYGNFDHYLDSLVNNKTISAWKALPYDWRLDLGDIVNGGTADAQGDISYLSSTTPGVSYMISQIQTLADNSITGKVTIVTHSNGGLVVKALIQKLEDMKAQGRSDLVDKIDNVIMVSAPQYGALDAVASILHGYKINYVGGLVADEAHGRAMAENMPGAYNLLPSGQYFADAPGPVITFATSTDAFSNLSKKYGRTISDLPTLEKFLTGADGRLQPDFTDINDPNVLNKTLLTKAESQHTDLDARQFPSTINLIQVAGVGVKTLSGIMYGKTSVCSSDGVLCKDALDPEPVTSVDGDGTVLASSALSSQGTKLYFDLNKYNDPDVGDKHDLEHSDILAAKNIQDLITNVLSGSNSLPGLITPDKPATGDKQLTVVAHSPISLDAYDAQGNHTGLINNPDPNSDVDIVERNIPNSFYTNFGEGKYLGIDADASTTVMFQGMDYGSFTLDTTLSQGNTVIASSTFVDIPVTPELKGSIMDSTSSAPILALDVDGDGVTDIVATSTSAFDPILYLEVMKKTVDSFDLKKAAEKTLLQKLDQLETKIKKGKMANADKQVQKFIKKIQRIKKPLRNISTDERNQLVQMLSNLVDNLL